MLTKGGAFGEQMARPPERSIEGSGCSRVLVANNSRTAGIVSLCGLKRKVAETERGAPVEGERHQQRLGATGMHLRSAATVTSLALLARHVASFRVSSHVRIASSAQISPSSWQTPSARQMMSGSTTSPARGAGENAFDFETPVDRSNTGALKLDTYSGRDVIPLWVADMDLKTSPAITDALKKRVDHGIFGYSFPTEGVKTAVMNYYKERHGVEVGDKSWLFFTPGTIQSMHAACKMLPETASVMVMTPSYPPFFTSPKNTGRGLVLVPAERAEGRWTLDWKAMEAAMKEHPETALLMLCNPYNPVGRVFTEEELRKVGEFCERHDLTIVSDEIHSDLILDDGLRHISMLALDDGRFAERTILLNAPSKTYNVPGLGCSYAIIPNDKLRLGFARAAKGWIGLNSPLGYVGCEAAYNEGEPWRQALLEHLRGNRDALYAFMEERLPELRLDPMEATYLAWVDVTTLGWKSPALEFERAGVGLTDGKTFLGEGYVRINFACPREMLMEGLRRMEQAVIEGHRLKEAGKTTSAPLESSEPVEERA